MQLGTWGGPEAERIWSMAAAIAAVKEVPLRVALGEALRLYVDLSEETKVRKPGVEVFRDGTRRVSVWTPNAQGPRPISFLFAERAGVDEDE